MFIIAGLGNPRKKYKNTRHNLGATLVESFQKQSPYNFSPFKEQKKFQAYLAKSQPPTNHILVLPQTFMNNSGLTIKKLVDTYQLSPSQLIVVYDEIDLPLGTIKIRVKGSAAGHKGVQSIIDHLGTNNFIRLRLGIKPLKGSSVLPGFEKFLKKPLDKFILAPFSKEEKNLLTQEVLPQAKQALITIIDVGVDTAMNLYNRRK